MDVTRDDDTIDEVEDRLKLESLVRIHTRQRPTSIERIAPGLGTRRFYRIRLEGGAYSTLVARIEADSAVPGTPGQPEAPAWLPEPPLEPVRQFLEDAGLPVPHCVANLPDQGVCLLEDVGDRTLKDAIGSERDALYREACEILPRLQRLSASVDHVPAFGRVFDRALIESKAWKWLHWTIPGLLGRAPTEQESASVGRVFDEIGTLLDEAPRRLAHRDFKAENLHLMADSGSDVVDSLEHIVMIDVQGAFMAPPEYDLVCLLYDIQVDLDESFAMECFRATLPNLPDTPDPKLAALRFDAIATLLLCKVISQLVHAKLNRNDARRWQEIPRGLTLLARATGRLTRSFPEIRGLVSVIPALTLAASSSDSSGV